MVGLDGAGKTTILYKLKGVETMQIYPTHGFNMETFQYMNTIFNVYDLGGKQNLRPFWKYKLQYTQQLIFVIDAEDQERIEEARHELMMLLADRHLNETALLILANKQDAPNAMTIKEIGEKLGLRYLTNRKWYIAPTSAVSGEGLWEGMEWLAKKAHGQ